MDKLKALNIWALSKHSLCLTPLLRTSFRKPELSLQATCTIVLTFLSAHQIPERVHSFPCPHLGFLCPPLLPHSRWLLRILPKWLLSFLLQGCSDHLLLPLMTGRRASSHSSRQWLRWTRWFISCETLVCFMRCFEACYRIFLCNLNTEQIQTSRDAEMKRICLLLRCHLPSEHLSDSTFYIFRGDKVTHNVLAEAVPEHSAVCGLDDSAHWGCWFALIIVKFFCFFSLLRFPIVLHNTRDSVDTNKQHGWQIPVFAVIANISDSQRYLSLIKHYQKWFSLWGSCQSFPVNLLIVSVFHSFEIKQIIFLITCGDSLLIGHFYWI